MNNLFGFIIASCLIFVTSSCGDSTRNKEANKKNSDTKKELATITIEKSSDFDAALKTGKPTVVSFSAPWCGACKIMKPIFREFADKNSNIQCLEINVDDLGELARSYKISGIPTFVLFKDSKELESKSRIIGALSADDFSKKIINTLA